MIAAAAWLLASSAVVGKGRLVPTIPPRSLAGFVTDITITSDVTFDFNSSKKEKEIIVITVGWQGREPSALLFLFLFLQAVEHEGGFIAGDTSFQIKRENGE